MILKKLNKLCILCNLEKVENVVVFLSHVHLRLEQIQQNGGGHDGTRVHHWIVWLIFKRKKQLLK